MTLKLSRRDLMIGASSAVAAAALGGLADRYTLASEASSVARNPAFAAIDRSLRQAVDNETVAGVVGHGRNGGSAGCRDNRRLGAAGSRVEPITLGLAGAGAQASRAVDHSQGYKAMSMKDDLAHRSPDIHWPTGFEPEKADLFAHNGELQVSSA